MSSPVRSGAADGRVGWADRVRLDHKHADDPGNRHSPGYAATQAGAACTIKGRAVAIDIDCDQFEHLAGGFALDPQAWRRRLTGCSTLRRKTAEGTRRVTGAESTKERTLGRTRQGGMSSALATLLMLVSTWAAAQDTLQLDDNVGHV